MQQLNDHLKIINIINFVRMEEPRCPTRDLFEPVVKQVELLKKHNLPATFLLQYDALINGPYVELLRNNLDFSCYEVGAWLEIVQPLVEKAGIKWRGRYSWDWHAHVGFSIGYTPQERERIVDVFMEDFRLKFGNYPESVGSWFIDAYTLGYLSDRYGIVASCNCKDQRGTDGYTLWGGYWNQAYYPSRTNAYIPAQHSENMISVPVFRMLGSDPIYQYDAGVAANGQEVISLEPICNLGGGSASWVRWFFQTLIASPCASFGYAQVGQENSFGWPAMERGFIDQIELLAELSRKAKLRIETLRDSGRWFRSRYSITPPSIFAALEDWKDGDCGSIWYNSRFYRANLYWEDCIFRIRDLHLFDEKYEERYLNTVARKPDTCDVTDNVNAEGHSCTYDALPVLDGASWSSSRVRAGLFPVDIRLRPLKLQSTPTVEENGDTLISTCCLINGDILSIICSEKEIDICMQESSKKDNWLMEFRYDPDEGPVIDICDGSCLSYLHEKFMYSVYCRQGKIKAGGEEGVVMFIPEQSHIILKFTYES